MLMNALACTPGQLVYTVEFCAEISHAKLKPGEPLFCIGRDGVKSEMCFLSRQGVVRFWYTYVKK